MSSTLTLDERLRQLDREVGELRDAFLEAATQLERAPEVDSSFRERWTTIGRRVREVKEDLKPADFDADQAFSAMESLFDIRDLLAETPSLDTIDRLLVETERVRQVIRDALDERVAGPEGSVDLVVGELTRSLPSVRRDAIAELVGVDRRTLTRWRTQTRPPSGRLRMVARLVAILRHNWTEEGITAWFHRPRRDLGGRTPLALLAESPIDEQALISAACAGRAMYAS